MDCRLSASESRKKRERERPVSVTVCVCLSLYGPLLLEKVKLKKLLAKSDAKIVKFVCLLLDGISLLNFSRNFFFANLLCTLLRLLNTSRSLTRSHSLSFFRSLSLSLAIQLVALSGSLALLLSSLRFCFCQPTVKTVIYLPFVRLAKRNEKLKIQSKKICNCCR